MRSVLIVKLGAIGDVLMVIPAAHELHRRGYRVDWVCGQAVLPLLQLYGWVNPIVVDDGSLLRGTKGAQARVMLGLWRRLLGAPYDLVATLSYDRRYRLLAWPVRAARRVGLSERDRALRLMPGRHHTDEYARILLGWEDTVRTEGLAPVRVAASELPPTPLPRKSPTRVVLAPAGARNLLANDPLRRWPAENYASLARELALRGVEVVLVGGADDDWVREYFEGAPVTDLIGKLSLQETLALLNEEWTVVVTHDTGPLHLAGVTRARVLGIFGPTDPRGRLPQRAGAVAIWGGEGFACRPCYDGKGYADCPRNECMRQVTTEMVLGEVQRMLNAMTAGELEAPRVMVRDMANGLVHLGK